MVTACIINGPLQGSCSRRKTGGASGSRYVIWRCRHIKYPGPRRSWNILLHRICRYHQSCGPAVHHDNQIFILIRGKSDGADFHLGPIQRKLEDSPPFYLSVHRSAPIFLHIPQ